MVRAVNEAMMAGHIVKGKGKEREHSSRDVVYTPFSVAKAIIDKLPLKNGETVLDPFYGKGAFYEQYPENVKKEWCEIEKNKDFFDFNKHVDWIISNPPYSIFNEVAKHSYEIADNVVYLMPLCKACSSFRRIKMLENYGGVKEIYYFNSSKCDFPFGFPCAAIWAKRGYKGKIKMAELAG